MVIVKSNASLALRKNTFLQQYKYLLPHTQFPSKGLRFKISNMNLTYLGQKNFSIGLMLHTTSGRNFTQLLCIDT